APWSRSSAMRRRASSVASAALGCAILAGVGLWSGQAGAQGSHAPYRIGILNDARAANHPAADGLKAGLREAGLQEGRDVIFDVRRPYGSAERMLAAAAAVAKSGADVIFTSGEAATLAAKVATRTIPVVFTLVGDPMAAGVVKSLAQPEAN